MIHHGGKKKRGDVLSSLAFHHDKSYDLEGYKNMLIILPTPNPSQEGNLLIGKGRLIPLLGGVRGG